MLPRPSFPNCQGDQDQEATEPFDGVQTTKALQSSLEYQIRPASLTIDNPCIYDKQQGSGLERLTCSQPKPTHNSIEGLPIRPVSGARRSPQAVTMVPTPISTPKRKRHEMTIDHMPEPNTLSNFTFGIDYTVSDGSVSPRTSVAHRFQGLALEGGGGVIRYRTGGGASPSPDPNSMGLGTVNMDIDVDDGGAQRKRPRLPDFNMLAAEEPDVAYRVTRGPTEPTQSSLDLSFSSSSAQSEKPKEASRSSAAGRKLSPKSLRFALDTAIIEQSETIANTDETKPTTVRFSTNDDDPADAAPTTSTTTASIEDAEQNNTSNVTADIVRKNSPTCTSEPRVRNPNKRAGTPPPSASKAKSKSASETVITDPLRASLTWHEDEITIYDPDDSDDDGTGINGIGFKPTPAIAYARTVKRRQQLAEYKKREEKEARARRSQRRGGGLEGRGSASGRVGSPARSSASDLSKGVKAKAERRRVRFLESVVKEAIGV